MKRRESFPVRVASIDIGTNGIRFLACEFVSRNRYEVIESKRFPVRLGHNSFISGQLEDGTQDAAIEALGHFRKALKRLKIRHYRAVATSAVRESKNGAQFVKTVKRRTGIDIDIISGSEEARLVSVAVKRKIPFGSHTWLIVNVGGGSIEVCLTDASGIIWNQTHTMGAVRIYEELTKDGEEPARFRQLIAEYLSSVKMPARKRGRKYAGFIAAGGNIETLAKLADLPADEAGTCVMRKAQLRSLISRLAKLSYDDRVKKLDLRRDRADVILPAAMVYEKFAMIAGASKIIIPNIGTREGIIFDLVDKAASRSDHLIEREKQVFSVALDIGRRYQFDELHGLHVAGLALSLFEQIKDLVDAGPNDGTILLAAGILHDIGTFISYKGHHKHSLYLISQADIPGLNEREVLMAANIARYHRKAEPAARHDRFAVLTPSEQRRVERLAAILRIADALDRDHTQNVRRILVSLEHPNLLLTLETRTDTCIEEWAIRKKGELFERVFDLHVIIRNNVFAKERLA